MSVRSLLEAEIQEEFKELKTMEVGTEKYEKTVDRLAKLIDREIELERVEIDIQDKIENRASEHELKLMEIQMEKKDRKIKNGLTLLGIISSAGLAVWGTLSSFKFEKDDTVTTTLGRGWLNKLLPKK